MLTSLSLMLMAPSATAQNKVLRMAGSFNTVTTSDGIRITVQNRSVMAHRGGDLLWRISTPGRFQPLTLRAAGPLFTVQESQSGARLQVTSPLFEARTGRRMVDPEGSYLGAHFGQYLLSDNALHPANPSGRPVEDFGLLTVDMRTHAVRHHVLPVLGEIPVECIDGSLRAVTLAPSSSYEQGGVLYLRMRGQHCRFLMTVAPPFDKMQIVQIVVEDQ